MENKYYILYDGDCGFCNFWVQWILKKDKKDKFLFAALQSGFGQNFLRERSLNMNDFDTIILYAPNQFYKIKSDAILDITNILGGTLSLLSIFKIFPRFLRDGVYGIISKNRKNLMQNKCLLPTVEERKKFIL